MSISATVPRTLIWLAACRESSAARCGRRLRGPRLRYERGRDLGHVVPGALDLGEEVLIRQHQRSGEVVREVNLDESRGLGVTRPVRLQEAPVQVRLVEE